MKDDGLDHSFCRFFLSIYTSAFAWGLPFFFDCENRFGTWDSFPASVHQVAHAILWKTNVLTHKTVFLFFFILYGG